MTLPIINIAKRVSFWVTGGSKASLVAKILKGSEEEKSLPAALVQPAHRILEWYLDHAAGVLFKITEK